MPEAPPRFVEYPRHAPAPGTSEQLRALMEGYYGLNTACLLNALVAAVAFGIAFMAAPLDGNASTALMFAAYAISLIAAGFLSHPVMKKIGFGANWSPTQIFLATAMVVLGGLCFFMLGVFGYVIVQSLAGSRIRRYGVAKLRRKEIERRIDELQAEEAHRPPAPAVAPQHGGFRP